MSGIIIWIVVYIILPFFSIKKKHAFDTVNHDILLAKLELYGIKNRPLMVSYLSDRSQKCSTLGPLLFSIYIKIINDLPNCLQHSILSRPFPIALSTFWALFLVWSTILHVEQHWALLHTLGNIWAIFHISREFRATKSQRL
jgi:hypothetical protein